MKLQFQKFFFFSFFIFFPFFSFSQGKGKWTCMKPLVYFPRDTSVIPGAYTQTYGNCCRPYNSYPNSNLLYGASSAAYWSDKVNGMWRDFGRSVNHPWGQSGPSSFSFINFLMSYFLPTFSWLEFDAAVYQSCNSTGNICNYYPLHNNTGYLNKGVVRELPVYVAQGIASPYCVPGGRKGALCWTDNNGLLWLYGGSDDTGLLDDMWHYDISIHMWTWVSGHKTTNHAPVYGNKGVAAAANNPGGRDGSITNWVDSNNCLWLFGGNVNNLGVGNDLWKYDINSGLWTWVNGSNTVGSAGNYGTMGVAAASNQPPARTGYAAAVDAQGHLLLFGGDNRNDVWSYDISSNMWTWINGATTVGDAGQYLGYCQTGMPAARTGWHAVALHPHSCNQFYLFGGAADSVGTKISNDLWLYDGNNNTFKWLSGKFNNRADSNGLYGIIGVWHSYNRIAPRQDYSMWCDGQNNLWIEGGRFCWGKTNHDLWEYQPDTSCGIVIPKCDTTYGSQLGSLCNANDSFQLPDYTFVYNTGTYISHILNVGGCDSMVTTTVSLHGDTYSQVYTIVCNNHPYYNHNGFLLSSSGVYTDTTKNYVGCDSFITLHLTILLIDSITIKLSICSNQTYTLPNGKTVNVGGTYIDTLPNRFGCDSIITTVLNIKPINRLTINQSICANQTYTLPNGKSVNVGGIYIDTLPNKFGCDSIITTVLTIKPINHLTINPSICANQTYTLPNGKSVNVGGTYMDTLPNKFGCDSIITTLLIIKPINQLTINQSICPNQTYILPKGKIVHVAGIYKDTFSNQFACDSIITTILHINPIQNVVVAHSICSIETYTLPNGQVVNTAGTYTDTLMNHFGCDSIISTVLTVTPVPVVYLSSDTSFCMGNEVVINATIAATNAQYQWNDLSTNPVKTIAASGLYKITITAPPCKTIVDSIRIVLLDCDCQMLMPNAFSPNNDNLDESIKPIYACDLTPQDYSFKIFNRWGQQVFQTTDYHTAWDGTFNGKPQPIETYIYCIEWRNATNQLQIKKGDVSLVR